MPHATTLVFDIETVGLPWLDLDPMLREWLTRGAEDGEAYRSKKDWRSLSPYAAKVVVVAALNPETGHGKVWYEAAEPSSRPSRDGLFEEIGGDERALLAGFWETAARFDRLVSFNGRSFDGPFLSVRSAIHGVAPSRNLAGYRYSVESHVDLMEVLTFQGAAGTRPSPIDTRFAAGLALLEEGSGARYVIQLMMTDARDPDYLRAYLAEASRAIGPEALFLYPSGSAETPKVGVLYGAFRTRQEANQAMGSLPDNLRQFRPYVRAIEAVRTDIRRVPSA